MYGRPRGCEYTGDVVNLQFSYLTFYYRMKRIVFIDYVRIFACFLVMLVHAAENYYGAPDASDLVGPTSFLANEADRFWVSLYDGCSRLAVPLFMIVSAYLLVPLSEGMSTAQFYKRRALRILPPFFIFIILYSTIPLFWNQIDPATSVHDLSRAFINFPTLAGHLWFMYPLIGLYLFMPVISPWLAKVSAKEERIFVWLFAISTCMPYLRRWLGEVWGECFWNEFHLLWYFSGFLGYLVLAHYIRVHLDWSRKKRLIIGSIMTVVGAAWTVLSFYIQAVPGELHVTPEIELGWAFCTINVLMLTTGAFLLFTCMRREHEPKVITELSNLSYGMYLMHIFWLGLWVSVIKDNLACPTGLAIPVIAVATFLCCWATTKIISLIPGGSWVVGTNTSFRKKN